MKGPDHAASLEPAGLAKLTRDIRAVESAMSGVKTTVLEREVPIRTMLAKSIVTARPVSAGSVLTADDLTVKSLGDGLSPHLIGELVGRTLLSDLPADAPLSLEVIGEGAG